MSSELITIDNIERMALAVSSSKLFGMKTKDEAIALMLVAQSEGLHPMRAAMEYHIIQGRPALKADAMLARFQNAGGKVSWGTYTDEKVEGTFSHPLGGTVTVDWTIDRATQAGLYGKNPTWKTYPRAMLRARVLSEGIRTVYPGVAVGIYTPEEVQDMEEKQINPQPIKKQSKKETEQVFEGELVVDNETSFNKDVIESHIERLKQCVAISELQAVWQIIPKELQVYCLSEKDKQKEILIKQQEVK